MTYPVFLQPILVYFNGIEVGKGWYIFYDNFQDVFVVDMEGKDLPKSVYHLIPNGETILARITSEVQ